MKCPRCDSKMRTEFGVARCTTGVCLYCENCKETIFEISWLRVSIALVILWFISTLIEIPIIAAVGYLFTLTAELEGLLSIAVFLVLSLIVLPFVKPIWRVSKPTSDN